ncbi:hypothetical protein NL463_31035, partial [Klebsiella pneumoniae]|nr:hypothetical protein [Klebsiella pneumoniae]
GLHRMEAGPGGRPAFRLVPLMAGRVQVPIGAILEDGGGRLWVSTTVGIARFDPVTGRTTFYTARDGVIDGTYFVGA